MTDTLKADMGLIGKEIIRANEEKFTGKLNVTLHMKNGGIGQITVLMQKNLKGKAAKRAKNSD